MKNINIFKAMIVANIYKKSSEHKRKEIREKRLKSIVEYAKNNSEYYKKLYENIPENFSLSDLTPTNKVDLMKNFDQWITVKDIKLEEIKEFMKDLDNIGRKLKNKYLVFSTSGSTGEPSITICDNNTNNIMGAITATRSYARKEDLKAFIKGGKKTIGIFATGGFYLGYGSVRYRVLSMPWKKKQMAVTSALLPIDKIVKELNDFNPTMLGGYPSVIELLVDEKLSGKLNISPKIVMTGGEYLSDETRIKISNAFNCYVQTSYSCTEMGTIACECREKKFHINDDWVIVEPVDKYNKPVEEGVLSDKILVTNLFNYSQPYIRYEITDRVIYHTTKCSCGNTSPWIELEGRTDEVVNFLQGEKEIKISPMAFYAILKEVEGLRRFQMIVKDNKIEVRIIVEENFSKENVFMNIEASLKDFLYTHGLMAIEVFLSDKDPYIHEKSGKFKHIINENK